jgi:hypothetical protein
MTDLSGVFNQMDSRKDKTLKALRHWLREIRSEYDASKYDSDATLAELFRTYATQTQDWIAEINALDTITDTPPVAAPVAAQAADGGTGVRYVVLPIEENFFIQDTVRGLIPAIGFATRGIAQATVDNLNAGQRFFAHECFIYEAKSFTVERWYDSEQEANTEARRLNAGNGNGGE